MKSGCTKNEDWDIGLSGTNLQTGTHVVVVFLHAFTTLRNSTLFGMPQTQQHNLATFQHPLFYFFLPRKHQRKNTCTVTHTTSLKSPSILCPWPPLPLCLFPSAGPWGLCRPGTVEVDGPGKASFHHSKEGTSTMPDHPSVD